MSCPLSDDEVNEQIARVEAQFFELALMMASLEVPMRQAAKAWQSLAAAIEVMDLEYHLETGRHLSDDIAAHERGLL